ncbi:MAG: hypothetical protein M9927_07820 [Anaerolineae bacterium]|nr:hypothetical protein [Anaerolineae bacterium]
MNNYNIGRVDEALHQDGEHRKLCAGTTVQGRQQDHQQQHHLDLGQDLAANLQCDRSTQQPLSIEPETIIKYQSSTISIVISGFLGTWTQSCKVVFPSVRMMPTAAGNDGSAEVLPPGDLGWRSVQQRWLIFLDLSRRYLQRMRQLAKLVVDRWAVWLQKKVVRSRSTTPGQPEQSWHPVAPWRFDGSTLTIANSTIDGNVSASSYAGVYVEKRRHLALAKLYRCQQPLRCVWATTSN